jgi:N6-adenosine-specific RNA methylase IME4
VEIICLLAISKKTKAKSIVINNGIHQIIESPIQKHSEKPDIIRGKIIQLLGNLPRIELFARKKMPGWDSWGNEIISDIKLR